MSRKQRLAVACCLSLLVNGLFWLAYGRELRRSSAAAPHRPDTAALKPVVLGRYVPLPPAVKRAPQPDPDAPRRVSGAETGGKAGGASPSQRTGGSQSTASDKAGGAQGRMGSLGGALSQSQTGQSGTGAAAMQLAQGGQTAGASAGQNGASGAAQAATSANGKSGASGDSAPAQAGAGAGQAQRAGQTTAGAGASGKALAQGQKPSGKTRSAATRKETTSLAAEQRDNKEGSDTRAAEKKAEREEAAKKPKPTSAVSLKVIKMWSPKPGQKFNLASSLNISLPKTLELVPGPPLTSEQIEELKKLLQQQKLRHVGLDRKQLKKLLEARRTTESKRPPEKPKPGDDARKRQRDRQAAKPKPRQPRAVVSRTPKLASASMQRPRSPFTYKQWNSDMFKRWAPREAVADNGTTQNTQDAGSAAPPSAPNTRSPAATGTQIASTRGVPETNTVLGGGNANSGTAGQPNAGQPGAQGAGAPDNGANPGGPNNAGNPAATVGNADQGNKPGGNPGGGLLDGGNPGASPGAPAGQPAGNPGAGKAPAGGNQNNAGGLLGAGTPGGNPGAANPPGGNPGNGNAPAPGKTNTPGNAGGGLLGGGTPADGGNPPQGSQGPGNTQTNAGGGHPPANGGNAGQGGLLGGGAPQGGNTPGSQNTQGNAGGGLLGGGPPPGNAGGAPGQNPGGAPGGLLGGGNPAPNAGTRNGGGQAAGGGLPGGGAPAGGAQAQGGLLGGGAPGGNQGQQNANAGQPGGGAPGGMLGGGQGQAANQGQNQNAGGAPGPVGDAGQGQQAASADGGMTGDGSGAGGAEGALFLGGEQGDGMDAGENEVQGNTEDTGFTSAAVASAPDLPIENPNAKKGVPGSLVLPPSPPMGTETGKLPTPRPVKKTLIQTATAGAPAAQGRQATRPASPRTSRAPQKMAKAPVGMPQKPRRRAVRLALTVGSTSVNGTLPFTVMPRPHLPVGAVSDAVDPPLPPAKGVAKSPRVAPKSEPARSEQAARSVRPTRAAQPRAAKQASPPIVRTARNSQGIKNGTEQPLPPTPLPDSDMEVGDGSGLKGEYYLGRKFDQYQFTRADPMINFDWKAGQSPSPRIPSGTDYTIRWTGKIQPKYSETYTFYATVDDGVRLWINHHLIIDDWTLHAATQFSNTIPLQAGQQYDIKLEYLESAGGAATIQLYWESPSQPKEFIPENVFFYPLPGDEEDMKRDKAPL